MSHITDIVQKGRSPGHNTSAAYKSRPDSRLKSVLAEVAKLLGASTGDKKSADWIFIHEVFVAVPLSRAKWYQNVQVRLSVANAFIRFRRASSADSVIAALSAAARLPCSPPAVPETRWDLPPWVMTFFGKQDAWPFVA